MNEKKPDKSYDLEPASEKAPDEAGDQPNKAHPGAETPDEQAPDEQAHDEQAPERPEAIEALDVCPNCSSPLGGVDAVVCLRCGFDLKTLKVIEVKTGETTVPDSDEAEEAAPLSVPGAGDLWLPGAMAVVGLGVLGIGYLAGAPGLFDAAATAGTAGEEAVGFGKRLEGLVGMLVRTSVLALAGLGGLSVLAHMLETRLGGVKLASVRMLGISAAIGLLAFFNVNSIFLELTIEAVCQAVAFVGLAMVLFSLTVRDAATLMGLTVFSMIGLLLLSALVLWSAGPQG